MDYLIARSGATSGRGYDITNLFVVKSTEPEGYKPVCEIPDLWAQRGLYRRLYQLQFYQDYKRTFAERGGRLKPCE